MSFSINYDAQFSGPFAQAQPYGGTYGAFDPNDDHARLAMVADYQGPEGPPVLEDIQTASAPWIAPAAPSGSPGGGLTPDGAEENAATGMVTPSPSSTPSPQDSPAMPPTPSPPANSVHGVPDTILSELHGLGRYKRRYTLGPRQPKPARVTKAPSPEKKAGNKPGQTPGHGQALRAHKRCCKPVPGCQPGKCPLMAFDMEEWHKKANRRKKNPNLPEHLQNALWEHIGPDDQVQEGSYAGDGSAVMPAAGPPPKKGKIVRTKRG